MAGIKDWSTTAANNDDADANINWLENQAPSSVNNSARAMMAAIRTQWEDREWFDYGHVVTRTGNTTFTVPTDLTAIYLANRPIRCSDSSTLYGYVASSSYGAPNTTVTVTLDSGNLSASLTGVSLGHDPSHKPIHSTSVRNAASTAAANTFTAAQTVRVDDATTNAVTTVATVSHTTSGTPANNIGVGIDFEVETSAGNNEVGAKIEAIATDTTSTSEDFKLSFKTMAAGAAAAERMTITQGLAMTGATGGDQGDGTGNFTEVYKNGVALGSGVGGSSMVLIKSQTVSGTPTSLSFLTADGVTMDSTYEKYVLIVSDLRGTSGGVTPSLRVSEDGSALISTGTPYQVTGLGSDAAANQLWICDATSGVKASGVDSGISGELWFFKPSSAGRKQIRNLLANLDNGSVMRTNNVTGWYNSNNAFTGFALYPGTIGTNTWASGRATLYGIKHA